VGTDRVEPAMTKETRCNAVVLVLGAVLAVAGVVAGTALLGVVPRASADPVVPGMQSNCESGFNGTLWCDGPIRPDGTWAGCFAVEATQRCFMYNPANPPGLPLGQPNHHIGLP
jgi:hypothetical protein